MGSLISRRRRSKAKAKNEPKQAINSVHPAKKSVVEENSTGDGFISNSHQHRVTQTRLSPENKKRRDSTLTQRKDKEAYIALKLKPTIPQVEYFDLPGAVPSSHGDSAEEKTSDQHGRGQGNFQQKADSGCRSDQAEVRGSLLTSRQKFPDSFVLATSDIIQPCDRLQTQATASELDVTEEAEAQEDENCNILKEGTLLAEFRNLDLYGAVSDEDFTQIDLSNLPYSEKTEVSGGGSETQSCSNDPTQTVQETIPGRVVPKKRVQIADTCTETRYESPSIRRRRTPSGGMLAYSLEDIMQTVYDADVLEVQAITGTANPPALTQTVPECGLNVTVPNPPSQRACGTTYDVDWTVDMLDQNAVGDDKAGQERVGQAENSAWKLHVLDASSAEDGDDNDTAAESDADIAEDTLDCNVDDRIRSPPVTEDIPGSQEDARQNLDISPNDDLAAGDINGQLQLSDWDKENTSAKDYGNDHTLDEGSREQGGDFHARLTGDIKVLRAPLEGSEADAVTMLLLTGSMPKEESSKDVCRGAGDSLEFTAEQSKKTVVMDYAVNKNELENVLNAKSRLSCQLEQLQTVASDTPGIPVLSQTHEASDSSMALAPNSQEQGDHDNARHPVSECSGTEMLQSSVLPGNNSEQETAMSVQFECAIDAPASMVGATSQEVWEFATLHRAPAVTDLGGLAAASQDIKGTAHTQMMDAAGVLTTTTADKKLALSKTSCMPNEVLELQQHAGIPSCQPTTCIEIFSQTNEPPEDKKQASLTTDIHCIDHNSQSQNEKTHDSATQPLYAMKAEKNPPADIPDLASSTSDQHDIQLEDQTTAAEPSTVAGSLGPMPAE